MQPTSPKLVTAGLWLVVISISSYLLVIARDLLIPLVLAIFVWYLINLLARQFGRIKIGAKPLPVGLQFLFAIGVAATMAGLFGKLITANINQVIETAPAYQANINQLITNNFERLGLEEPPALRSLVEGINFAALLRALASALGGLMGNLGLITVYLVFLFLEQKFFPMKMRAIFPNDAQYEVASRILRRVDQDVSIYLGIKTLVSALTGIISWVIMSVVGLDFAGFWALLIFVLNFIPNIGSLIATILPTLLALLQFDTLGPFMIIGLGVGATQLVIGNFIEPPLMGRSLNISPLVVLLSLVLWGSMWGIPGMFLCVPITVILMIILYQFESARWIALALSKNGQVRPSH
jgi:AI-2 transport protein TqsA